LIRPVIGNEREMPFNLPPSFETTILSSNFEQPPSAQQFSIQLMKSRNSGRNSTPILMRLSLPTSSDRPVNSSNSISAQASAGSSWAAMIAPSVRSSRGLSLVAFLMHRHH
jgi:hypothetical protein